MSRRINLAPHLSSDELEQRYHQAQKGIESCQFHIIWLLSEGKTTEAVVQLTGYSRNWIYRLVRRYNEQGASALGDQRRHNQGAKPLLDDSFESLDELEDILMHRCQQILRQQKFVQGLTQFHWWPHVEPYCQ
jgi:transposase